MTVVRVTSLCGALTIRPSIYPVNVFSRLTDGFLRETPHSQAETCCFGPRTPLSRTKLDPNATGFQYNFRPATSAQLAHSWRRAR